MSSSEPEAAQHIPTISPQDFILRTPLYSSVAISEEDRDWVQQVQYFSGPMDAYCLECQQVSIFHRDRSYTVNLSPSDAVKPRTFDVTFWCSRGNHSIYVMCRVDGVSISKIGQYPSLADLHAADIGQYRGVLGAERYRELARGVGLSAHGVGIGAFVYLRRIFESLIDEARQAAEAEKALDMAAFERGRMDDRILLLRNYLPAFLVENRSLYGILSKGVHSLTENECLECFNTVRLGVELVLDERLEQARKANKLVNATKAIAALKGQLGK